jgi:hypothetical protein
MRARLKDKIAGSINEDSNENDLKDKQEDLNYNMSRNANLIMYKNDYVRMYSFV